MCIYSLCAGSWQKEICRSMRGLQRREERLGEIFGDGKAYELTETFPLVI